MSWRSEIPRYGSAFRVTRGISCARAVAAVSAGDVIGLVLAVAALAYLVWALLFPERL